MITQMIFIWIVAVVVFAGALAIISSESDKEHIRKFNEKFYKDNHK